MALTDIVFQQANAHVAERGNTGVVQDNVSDTDVTTLVRSGVLQRWNATTSQWEVFPLRYRSGDGWV